MDISPDGDHTPNVVGQVLLVVNGLILWPFPLEEQWRVQRRCLSACIAPDVSACVEKLYFTV